MKCMLFQFVMQIMLKYELLLKMRSVNTYRPAMWRHVMTSHPLLKRDKVYVHREVFLIHNQNPNWWYLRPWEAMVKTVEYWSETSSGLFVCLFVFCAFQHFYDHISEKYDEKPSNTKFCMNRFMVAWDMTAWILKKPHWKQCQLAWFITLWNQANSDWLISMGL